jgi:TPP-dependent pyruvate/acetoin dehydrogenase alpha subunit
LNAAEIEDFETSVKHHIEEAIEYAEESPEPGINELLTDVYAQ